VHADGLDLRQHDVDVTSRRVSPRSSKSECETTCFIGQWLDLDHSLCLS